MVYTGYTLYILYNVYHVKMYLEVRGVDEVKGNFIVAGFSALTGFFFLSAAGTANFDLDWPLNPWTAGCFTVPPEAAILVSLDVLLVPAPRR